MKFESEQTQGIESGACLHAPLGRVVREFPQHFPRLPFLHPPNPAA